MDFDFKTMAGELACVYFGQVTVTDGTVRAQRHEQAPPDFNSFSVYYRYLKKVVSAVHSNASSEERDHSISYLSTISRGYDSPAVSTLAGDIGCTVTATIARARAVFPRSDSGERVAEYLGLDCTVVGRGGKGEPGELAFWAALGNPQDLNLAVLPLPKPPVCLFSGAYGGRVWNRSAHMHPAINLTVDTNMLGFSEYRLLVGCIHCPLPFIGFDNSLDLLRMSHSQEMAPWSIGGSYDRPIPRRIAEEAGVPRNEFGQVKSATHYEETFLWPYRADLRQSLRNYLLELEKHPPAPIPLYRTLNSIDRMLLLPLEQRFNVNFVDIRTLIPDMSNLIDVWAVNEMARRLIEPSRGDI